MKPRKNYRMRPKKSGAKKRQRVLSQQRRLVALGYKKEELEKMTTVEVRDLLKTAQKRKRQPSGKSKKTVKKAKAAKE